MHILLAAATSAEIQPTIDLLLKSPGHAAYPPIRNRVSTLTTGVGALPAAWTLTRQIDRDPPDLVIQAGIAGAFTGHSPGKVYAIRAETFADLGVWEEGRFQTVFDLHLASPDEPPFAGGRLVNPYPQLLELTGLDAVDAITVNEISTDRGRIRWLQRNTGAVVESMEGGALHYVALQEGIAFLQLRSISNTVGTRDKSQWNIPLAIARLNEQLVRLLQTLDSYDNRLLHSKNIRYDPDPRF